MAPVEAAVGGAIHTALVVGGVGVAENGDVDDIGVRGVHDDAADLLRIAESDVLPGFAGVGGFIDAVADRNRGAHVGFARAHIDGVVLRRCDRDGADGGDILGVEDGSPDGAGIGSFPDAAADRPEVESALVAGNAADGEDAATAEGADESPLEGVEEIRRQGSGGCERA
jgi:hypothetical protein